MSGLCCRRLIPVLVILCVILMVEYGSPAFGQVKLTGSETTPAAPAELSWGQPFGCLSSGRLTLRYPDGSVFTFAGPCEGRVVQGGLYLKTGPGLMRFMKQRSAFTVTTPVAVLGVRGTEFFLEPSPASFTVILEEGRLDVTPSTKSAVPISMQPGQTVTLQGGTLRVSPTTEAERKSWLSRFPTELLSSSGERRLSFGELFLFGMTRVSRGVVTVVRPNMAETAVQAPAVVPSDATVSCGASQTARLMLECGSVIDLGPGACVSIRPFSLEIRSGDVAIRHVGTPFPLKLSGNVSASLASESAVEFIQRDGAYMVRLQNGECRFGQKRETLGTGDCGKITNDGICRVPEGVPLAEWRERTAPASIPLPEFAPGNDETSAPPAEPMEPAGDAAASSVPKVDAKATVSDILRHHSSSGKEAGGLQDK